MKFNRDKYLNQLIKINIANHSSQIPQITPTNIDLFLNMS